MHATVEHAKRNNLIVIFDGKRNDIGSTAEAYARAYLGKVPVGGKFEPSWHADAMTVNPYLGTDGVMPFIKIAAREHKGVFVLVRTSNASAGEFQDLVSQGQPLYRHVAKKVLDWAEATRGLGLQPRGGGRRGDLPPGTRRTASRHARDPLARARLWNPGRNSRDIAPAFDENGLGALINNSRGITFAYTRQPYQSKFADRWQAAVRGRERDDRRPGGQYPGRETARQCRELID